jgi:hypothetical protein
MKSVAIREYMSRLDSENPITALDVVEDDLSFRLALPTGAVAGSSRDELWSYVSHRPPVTRRHHITRETAAGDFEVVYGVVTVDGVETGAFLASARLSALGRMQRYLVYFDPTFRLVDGTSG